MTNGADRQLLVGLPAFGVEATIELYRAAPTTTALIYGSLAEPLVTETSHACFDGHEVFCFLRPFPQRPTLENRTVRPKPGEIVFFYAEPTDFACLNDSRLTSGGSGAMYELAFMYGEVDLRHFDEEGLHGSLVGRIAKGFDDFAAACGRTLAEGRTEMVLRQH